jgi:hypothetical protein
MEVKELELSHPYWFLAGLQEEELHDALFALLSEEVTLEKIEKELADYLSADSVEILRAFASARWLGATGGLLGEVESLGQAADISWVIGGFRLADNDQRKILRNLERAILDSGGHFFLSEERPTL